MKLLALVAALAAILAFARAEDSPTPEAVYVKATALIKDNLKAPATAIFPKLDNADVSVCARAGENGTWLVWGYVDAQNSFGALLRKKWTVGFQDVAGKFTDIFFELGGEITGSVKSFEAIGKGLDARTGEKQGLSPKEIAALHRTRYHTAARDAAAKLIGAVDPKFSTLAESDDEWTSCHELNGNRIWEARGVVQYTADGKPAQAAWLAYVLEHSADGPEILWQKVADKTSGNLKLAQQIAGIDETKTATR